MVHPDNAVTQLARAVTRFGEYESPIVVTDTMRELLDDIGELTGLQFDENDPNASLQHFGAGARMLGAALRNTANPTMLEAGYKANVIPSSAEATIDTRFLPGQEHAWEAQGGRTGRRRRRLRVAAQGHRGGDDLRRRDRRRHGRCAQGRGLRARTRCPT